jgi:hypothetical protein
MRKSKFFWREGEAKLNTLFRSEGCTQKELKTILFEIINSTFNTLNINSRHFINININNYKASFLIIIIFIYGKPSL